MKQKKSASILKKFLIINLTVFSVLGLFTIIYLEAIQPTLVNERSKNHKVVINNTNETSKLTLSSRWCNICRWNDKT